ncbi:MAG: 50S ribosomal protein L32 [Geminicoccaceae bacterium]
MAVPRKKVSKSKRDMRRGHDRLASINLAECSNCGEPKRPHHVCGTCGYYNDREVIAQTSSSDEAAA